MDRRNEFRIIVIDDNAAIHQDFIKILNTNKAEDKLNILTEKLFGSESKIQNYPLPQFKIDIALQGQDGVERIKQSLQENNPYALAFVDVRMPPGWDGVETIKQIWNVDPDIQIVMCTAYSDYSWEETAEQLGLSDSLLILKKPFDNIAVRQLACALTKKWQLLKQARKYSLSLEKRVQERTTSLQHSLSLIRATIESSTDGILIVDNSGKIIDYNNQFIQMWKIPQAVLDSKDNNIALEYVIDQLDNSSEFLAKIKQLKNEPNSISNDVLKFKDGRIFERYSQPHLMEGKTVGRVWSFRDVTRRIYLEEELAHQATHDALTNLPNRVLLTDRIRQAVAHAKRLKSMIGILFFDLDRFKLINDSLSHQAGDQVLQAVAQRLLRDMREENTLARLGGDEFVMVVPHLDKKEQLISVANNLLEKFHKPFKINNREINLTTSIGISIYPYDATTVDELLRKADLAMYHAKESGANQFKFYTDELNEHTLQRLEKETELRHAITNNEFVLHYQPQFDIDSGKLVAVEALIRWQHPSKGLILPVDFIHLAEESGLIVIIGEWVLRTACLQIKDWQKQGLPPLRVAVNVTTYQFKQQNFVKTVSAILQETELQPEFLELELTENVIINNNETIRMINELKKIGVHIVLDDFGTGNSTLNYLRKIPIDRLKIDQSFIQSINASNVSNADEVIIQAIITMADGLDLEILAEGVETSKQLSYLKSQKCDLAQGFYFSKPLSVVDLESLLKSPTPLAFISEKSKSVAKSN